MLANNLPNYYKRVATVTPNAGDGQENWILKPNTEYRRVDGVTKVIT
ncbi:PF07588 domain protein [Leptospira noguchii str. 2001034031]|uniref:PF07588 domain protein n=1 Tax=Leptospira noguchii str. 2001034031 TaxID=1193053 RepID=M6XZT2_9LEPT|nr:PF07588 domain protein [Leptospira noguchii str. 2001034031]